jgi:adenosylhomocysteine nucleosidase
MNDKEAEEEHVVMVAAYRREVGPLIARIARQDKVRSVGENGFRFQRRGRLVALAIAGVGAENAYRSTCELLASISASGVLSIGFAGGLRDSLRVADLLLASEVIDEKSGERFPCDGNVWPVDGGQRGALLASAEVVNAVDAKRALAARWDAMAVDMESSGVARASKEVGLPFGAVKVISDVADESIAIDFQRCRSDDGGLSTWKIVREGMASPQGISDLWRLAKSSRQAAARLAVALCSD